MIVPRLPGSLTLSKMISFKSLLDNKVSNEVLILFFTTPIIFCGVFVVDSFLNLHFVWLVVLVRY